MHAVTGADGGVFMDTVCIRSYGKFGDRRVKDFAIAACGRRDNVFAGSGPGKTVAMPAGCGFPIVNFTKQFSLAGNIVNANREAAVIEVQINFQQSRVAIAAFHHGDNLGGVALAIDQVAKVIDAVLTT